MTKTYLFDFDGTLVDSMPVYGGVMLRILDEHNISYGDDMLKTITPLGYVGTARYYVSLGINKTEDELVELMTRYMFEQYSTAIPAKKNVESALIELKRRGCSLNVLTASPHVTLDPCLKRLGLWELFDNVWSCGDFDTTKSDVNIYIQAAERLGKAVDEVIFLDDNLNADLTAKKAGMVVYGVYDSSSEEYIEEIKAATDRYIDDFSQLLDD